MTGPAPVPVPPHAGGDEDEVRTLQHAPHLVGVLLDRLAADLRAGTRAEPARELLADLDLDLRLGVLERLRVRVDADELDALQIRIDHPVDGVATPTTHADHLHAGVLHRGVLELEDHHAHPPLGVPTGLHPSGAVVKNVRSPERPR